jgi:hypothetical protein
MACTVGAWADLPEYPGARQTSQLNLQDPDAMAATPIGKAIRGAVAFSMTTYRVSGGLDPQAVIDFYKKALAQNRITAPNTTPLIEWTQPQKRGVLVVQTQNPAGVLLLTAEAQSDDDSKAGEISAMMVLGRVDPAEVLKAMQVPQVPRAPTIIEPRSVSASGVRKVRLETPSGPVWVRSVDSGSLRVRLLGTQTDRTGYRIDVHVSGDEAAFQVSMPPNPSASAVELVVTRDVSVEIQSQQDAVLVQGPLKGVTVRTSNGLVVVRSVDGDVSVTNTDGAIEMADINGELKLDTSGGTIRGTGIALSGTQGLIKTAEGSISLDLAATKDCKAEVRTARGSITVRLPKDASVTIRAKSTGPLRLGAPLQSTKDAATGETVATMGGGRSELRLVTLDGGITVEPR